MNELYINNNEEYKEFKINYNKYIDDITMIYFYNIDFNEEINEILKLFINLEQLYIISCKNIKLIPNNLIKIEKINIRNNNDIEKLPNTLINLKVLQLTNTIIKDLPIEYKNLEVLEVFKCNNIKFIPKYNNLKVFYSFVSNENLHDEVSIVLTDSGYGITNYYNHQKVYLKS